MAAISSIIKYCKDHKIISCANKEYNQFIDKVNDKSILKLCFILIYLK